MREVIEDIRIMLGRELGAFQREIELFPDDELVWKTVPGIVNSAGNLALHVCGNLQLFVGAQLGGTGYVRNRELEFSRRSGTRVELIAALRTTADVVDAALSRVSDDAFLHELPEAKRGMIFTAHTFLIHLCAHTAFHLGQAGYLRRVLTGDPASSGPMSIDELFAAVNES
jgi:hypothetical protein